MRAVIFDWDLTLWNSWDIHLWLMERTGFDLGIIPPGAEAVAAEFHRPFHQHLLWFFGSTPDSQGELDTIVAAYLHHYHAIVGHRNYLYPGVASLLRGLRRRGIRIGILSDKVPEFGEAELRQSGMADLVEYTSFKTDRRPFKPDPTGLFHVLEGLGVEAADTMYVGDAPQDIACARDAGVRSAAAMWATIDADAIIAQQPTHRLHRPHQVMAVVAEINNYDGGFGGSNPWLRHLPWPWRPDADDPLGDQDAAVAASETPTNAEPDASWQYWPMARAYGRVVLTTKRGEPRGAVVAEQRWQPIYALGKFAPCVTNNRRCIPPRWADTEVFRRPGAAKPSPLRVARRRGKRTVPAGRPQRA